MKTLLCFVAVLALASVTMGASNPPGLTTALRMQLGKFMTAFQQQNAALASQYFTEDAVLMVADADAFVGRASTCNTYVCV